MFCNYVSALPSQMGIETFTRWRENRRIPNHFNLRWLKKIKDGWNAVKMIGKSKKS